MRPLALALFMIVHVGCNRGESPTEPLPVAAQAVETAENVHGVSLDPEISAVTAGESTTVTATLARPGAEIYFGSQDPSVAEVSGRIARGASSGVVTIAGVSAGEVAITYLVPNFGRAPGVGTAGSVIVAKAPRKLERRRGRGNAPRRRSLL